jgi:hypothetical protein
MTITLTREEAQQVLDALEKISMGGHPDWANDVTPILRARLAQPEPEPVAYRVWGRMGGISFRHTKPHESEYVEWDELYTAPPQREWQGLTDEEAKEVWKQLNYDLNHGKFAADDTERHVIVEFYRAVEAKLKEKNA